MPANISGIGTAVPPHAIPQREASRILKLIPGITEDQLRRYERLFSLSGISSRNSCILGFGEEPMLVPAFRQENASTKDRMEIFKHSAGRLALESCQKALQQSGLAPRAISHLIIVTCTGFFSPGIDLELISNLGLPLDTERILVGFMGCHAAINAIRLAKSIVESDSSANVLLCSVEICSIHLSAASENKSIMADSIFSDGSAALVVTNADSGWKIGQGASQLIPDTASEMSWEIGNEGFSMTLSSQVPAILKEYCNSFVLKSKEKANLSNVASWAIHPGGLKILKVIQQAIDLKDADLADSYEIFKNFGNMSSATLLFILQKMIRRSAPRPVLMLGFGPGLFCESVSFY